MANKEKNTALIAHAKTFANTPWCDDYEKMISGMLFVPLADASCASLTGRIDMNPVFPNY
jgi:hypothetical protein